MLKAIARYLKIDENYFEDAVRDGNSVLRALHYPPQSEPTGEHIRAGAHEDINAITLLLGAEEAGLELLTRDGRWIPVSPKPGELVINIGDMLQRLTNGKLRSTTHRVVNPAPDRASKARYSMPFFLHFRSDFLIDALPRNGAGRRAAEMASQSPPTIIFRSDCARSSSSRGETSVPIFRTPNRQRGGVNDPIRRNASLLVRIQRESDHRSNVARSPNERRCRIRFRCCDR